MLFIIGGLWPLILLKHLRHPNLQRVSLARHAFHSPVFLYPNLTRSSKHSSNTTSLRKCFLVPRWDYSAAPPPSFLGIPLWSSLMLRFVTCGLSFHHGPNRWLSSTGRDSWVKEAEAPLWQARGEPFTPGWVLTETSEQGSHMRKQGAPPAGWESFVEHRWRENSKAGRWKVLVRELSSIIQIWRFWRPRTIHFCIISYDIYLSTDTY